MRKLLAGVAALGLILSLSLPTPAGAVDITAVGTGSTSCPSSTWNNPGLGSSIAVNSLGQLCTTGGGGSSSGGTAAPASTTALASSLVVKASAGTLYSFSATADSTLAPTGSSVWYLMIFNATSAPADGAVTPVKCYQVSGAQTGGTFAAGGVGPFSAGITMVASTTGCFTKTASAHAFMSGDYQ